jgi:hypothetical protein
MINSEIADFISDVTGSIVDCNVIKVMKNYGNETISLLSVAANILVANHIYNKKDIWSNTDSNDKNISRIKNNYGRIINPK